MSASPIRRRPVALGLAVVFSLALLAGCTGQQEPGSYGDGVEKSFIEGCWQQKVLDDDPALVAELIEGEGFEIGDDDLERPLEKAAGDDAVDAAKDYCQCAYDAISDDIPFGEFKSVTDDLREDNGPLPESFQKVYAGCAEKA